MPENTLVIDPVVLRLLERACYAALVDAQQQFDAAKEAADRQPRNPEPAQRMAASYRTLLTAVAGYGRAKRRADTAAATLPDPANPGPRD